MLLFQKTVPCTLCKEVLTVVDQILKDNATEVTPPTLQQKNHTLIEFTFNVRLHL